MAADPFFGYPCIPELAGERHWKDPYKPHETLVQNPAVGELGRSGDPRVREALRRSLSLWAGPSFDPARCGCGQVLFTIDQPVGVDWLGWCANCDKAVGLHENKPNGAPCHEKPAPIDLYKEAVEEGVMVIGPGWPGYPPVECEDSHLLTPVCAQFPHKVDKETGSRWGRFCLPQVIHCSVRHKLPVTLLTGIAPTASELYGTPAWGFDLVPRWFPVVTEIDFLNSLAEQLVPLLDHLSPGDVIALRRVVDAIWCRTPPHGEDDPRSPALTGLMADWIYGCWQRAVPPDLG